MTTLLHDARTGDTRAVRLTECCRSPRARLMIRLDTTGNWRGQGPLSVARALWTLRWNRARPGQPADYQERKYRLRDNAERRSLRRRGYRESAVTICREDGLHEVWD